MTGLDTNGQPGSDSGTAPPPAAHRSRMKKLVLVAADGKVLCDVCHLADKPHTRLRGVIGWKCLHRGEGVLIRPAFSIHTSFVRFPVDAVFLDDDMTVLAVEQELKPWRMASVRKARAVLELAAGECKRLGVQPGDRLGWGLI